MTSRASVSLTGEITAWIEHSYRDGRHKCRRFLPSASHEVQTYCEGVYVEVEVNFGGPVPLLTRVWGYASPGHVIYSKDGMNIQITLESV